MLLWLLVAVPPLQPLPSTNAGQTALTRESCEDEKQRRAFLATVRSPVLTSRSRESARRSSAEIERQVDRIVEGAKLDERGKSNLWLSIYDAPQVRVPLQESVRLVQELSAELKAAAQTGDDRTMCVTVVEVQSRWPLVEAEVAKAHAAMRERLAAEAKKRGVSLHP